MKIEELKKDIARKKQNILITKILLVCNLISSSYSAYVFWFAGRKMYMNEAISFWGIMILSLIYVRIVTKQAQKDLPKN